MGPGFIPGGPKSGSRIRVPDLGRTTSSGSRPGPASTLAETLQVAYLRLLRHETGCAGRKSPNRSSSCPPCLIARPRTLAEPQQIVAVRFCAGRCAPLAAARVFLQAGRARACLSCNNLRPDVVRLPSQFAVCLDQGIRFTLAISMAMQEPQQIVAVRL